MELPLLDLSPYLANDRNQEQCARLCVELCCNLKRNGAVLVKDPRSYTYHYDRFINYMEIYFDSLSKKKPHLQNQVGITPKCGEISTTSEDRPDPNLCYIRKIAGSALEVSPFPELNADPVIPDGFPDWEEIMGLWGDTMRATFHLVAEMAAVGFKLPRDSFTSRAKTGLHVLAATGVDLEKYGEVGTVIERFPYDRNLLTIHARSLFPGSKIWTRNGEEVDVNVPLGYYLITTGKQMEWLTGGDILACKHEVIVKNQTVDVINKAKERNRSLWRVSSMLYSHVASEGILSPLGHFKKTAKNASDYDDVVAGDIVKGLADINPKKRKQMS